MTKELMSFEKFKHLMEVLLSFQEKKDKVSDFFEKELMQDSWCIFTFGYELEDTLVNMLADEFDCWFSFKDPLPYKWWEGKQYGYGNDIEEWLYSLQDKDKKTITINDKEYDVTDLGCFYDFLVNQYKEKHNLTES